MMEQVQEKQSGAGKVADIPQAGSTAEHQVVSVGRLLREGRERLGLSVDDVVNQIKLAPRQVRALEADDFESLPETAFVRGFVRSYAKVLQLDAQMLLDALPGAKTAQVNAAPSRVETPFPQDSERRQNMNLLIAALFIALLIAGFAAWQAYSPQQEAPDEAEKVADGALVSTPVVLPEQAEVLAASEVAATDVLAASAVQQTVSAVPATPVAESKPVTESKPVAKGRLHLVFDKESWTEIRDQTGKLLVSQINLPGSELNLGGSGPLSLVIGHASSVRLFYLGKEVDLKSHIGAGSDVARLTLE